MLVQIEKDYATIELEDLLSRSVPGAQNPPWLLHEKAAVHIEDYLNLKGITAKALQLEGRIQLDAENEIPVIVKAVERPPGQVQFCAFPKFEENWIVVEEAADSSRLTP